MHENFSLSGSTFDQVQNRGAVSWFVMKCLLYRHHLDNKHTKLTEEGRYKSGPTCKVCQSVTTQAAQIDRCVHKPLNTFPSQTQAHQMLFWVVWCENITGIYQAAQMFSLNLRGNSSKFSPIFDSPLCQKVVDILTKLAVLARANLNVALGGF